MTQSWAQHSYESEQARENKNERWSHIIVHHFSDRYCSVCLQWSLNTNHKHRHAALNLPFYFFIWSFVKCFWKTNGSLLNTLLSCLHLLFPLLQMIFYLWNGINQKCHISSYLQLFLCHFLFPNCYCSFVSNLDFLTCFHVFEPLLELLWSEAVLVKPVIPFDSLQHLQVAPHQPITSLHNHLYKVMNREYQSFFLTQIFTCKCN